MSEYTGGAGVEGYYADPYATLLHGGVIPVRCR